MSGQHGCWWTLCPLTCGGEAGSISGVEQASGAVLPTVGAVLELPELRFGRPQVVAGTAGLDRRVRWLHVLELADAAGLLQGGELILATGIALPTADAALRRYVADLAGAGAAGLVVELGRRFTELPGVLVRAADRAGLPVAVLRREVPFVKITEAVHSLIVAEQYAALRAAEQAHEVFTALCVRGASAGEIVAEVARIVAAPVVFENLLHQVLAYDTAGAPVDDVLRNWAATARAARIEARTGRADPPGWVVTRVESHGEVWGRLVLIPTAEPTPVQVMVLERGATALTLNRLLERNRDAAERQAHRSALTDLVEGRYGADREIHARAAALGVPTAGRHLVAVVVDGIAASDSADRAGVPVDPLREADLVAAAVRAAGLAGLVAPAASGRVRLLLSLNESGERDPALRRLAERIRDGVPGDPVVAVGSPVTELGQVRNCFVEADQVADAAGGVVSGKPYYELADIQLRGLLYTLGQDPRLQSFVERALGPVLGHDARHRTDLVGSLRAFLEAGGNKSVAADTAHLSRQSFYRRLSTVERVLGVDLESAEIRTSLHAALMAHDALRRQSQHGD